MSSGPSDANAQGALNEDVWAKAYDLARAIEQARVSPRAHRCDGGRR